MAKKRTPEELQTWSLTKERIGRGLKNYYQACTTDELPPQVRALIKKMDQEIEPSADQPEIIRDIEN